MSGTLIGSRPAEPDAIGPWSLLVVEVLDGVEAIVTGWGPMPRSGAEAALDLLALCAYDDGALVPFSLKVAEVDLATFVRVSFGDDAVRDLVLADNHLGVDPLVRWRRSSRQVGATFPEYPMTKAVSDAD